MLDKWGLTALNWVPVLLVVESTILYSGKFLNGANFCILFRMYPLDAKYEL